MRATLPQSSLSPSYTAQIQQRLLQKRSQLVLGPDHYLTLVWLPLTRRVADSDRVADKTVEGLARKRRLQYNATIFSLGR